MPKGYSRSAISTSEDPSAQTQTSKSKLTVMYCACSEFILVIDKPLHLLPQRQTDGAHIIRNAPGPDGQKKRVFKLNVVQQKPCIVERRNGLCERQYRLSCPRCTLLVGYTSNAPLTLHKLDQDAGARPAEFVYILRGALTETQGRVPRDAFVGEVGPGQGSAAVGA